MRAESRAAGVIVTVLVHLLAVVGLLHTTASVEKPPEAPATRAMSADELHGAGERIVRVDIAPGLAARGLACEGSSYVGIGITAVPGSERIVLVGDDTPASRAGLQRDDIVLNPEIWHGARREGELLRVVVLRAGARKVLWVLVGRVCIG